MSFYRNFFLSKKKHLLDLNESEENFIKKFTNFSNLIMELKIENNKNGSVLTEISSNRSVGTERLLERVKDGKGTVEEWILLVPIPVLSHFWELEIKFKHKPLKVIIKYFQKRKKNQKFVFVYPVVFWSQKYEFKASKLTRLILKIVSS